MGDALKAAGAVSGLGVAGILGVVAYAIYDDRRMAWMVVGGLMLCVILVLVIIAIRQTREMWVTRTAMLRVQNESSLIGMRSVALVKDVGPRGDPFTALLASMPGPDVVDGTAHGGLTWGDDGGGFHQGGGE